MTTDAPPPAITYEHKVKTIAAVLLAEAGWDWQGMYSVAAVIRNRGGDPYCVVTRPKQFSCLNRTTPKQLIQKHVAARRPEYTPRDYWIEWAMKFSNALFNDSLNTASLPAGEATHYHSTKITPRWAKGKKPLAVVGGHKFYKLP